MRISSAEFLDKPRDRRVYAIEDMAPEQLAALEKAEVPGEYAHLNAELKE